MKIKIVKYVSEYITEVGVEVGPFMPGDIVYCEDEVEGNFLIESGYAVRVTDDARPNKKIPLDINSIDVALVSKALASGFFDKVDAILSGKQHGSRDFLEEYLEVSYNLALIKRLNSELKDEVYKRIACELYKDHVCDKCRKKLSE